MASYETMQATLGGLDPLDVPTPGESLTTDPENPRAYERPPQFTDLNKAVDDLFMRMTSRDNIDQFLDLIRDGVPIENIAQVALFEGFRQGQFNPDLMLLMIEPTIYILLWLADYANINDVVLYPQDGRATITMPSKEESSTGGDTGSIQVGEDSVKRPESVTPSLLERITKEGK